MDTKPYQQFAETKLGFKFNDINLLVVALTHRSYVNEHKKSHLEHNERLEYLGDAVLELVTSLAVLAAVLNVFACICLICLSIPYLAHDTYVANPDAMLPMERWDGAGMALTVGLLPMIAANTLGCIFLIRKKSVLRALFFLPAAAELAIVVHYWVTSLR